MLTGTELGAALDRAIKLKGVTKKAVADHFGVKPPSVQDWIKFGRIGKQHLNELVAYFSDVVPPQHWGMRGVDLLLKNEGGGFTAIQFKSGVGKSTDNAALSTDVQKSLVERSSELAKRLISAARAGQLNEAGVQALEQTFAALTRPGTVSLQMKESDLDAQPGAMRDERQRKRGSGKE